MGGRKANGSDRAPGRFGSMLDDQTLWRLEADFWTGGPAHYRACLRSDAVMVFPEPPGVIVGRDAVLASLAGAPRWETVEMTERRLLRLGEHAAVLLYRVRALRAGTAYRALCSSSWAGGCMVHHQQTPLSDG